VLKYIAQASENTSDIPDLLKDSTETKTIDTVLRIITGDDGIELARRLAK